MDAMKPKTEESEEAAGMLNETEQFIEKIEAVEKDRKESQSSETVPAPSGIEIIVQRPSMSEGITEEENKEVFEVSYIQLLINFVNF